MRRLLWTVPALLVVAGVAYLMAQPNPGAPRSVVVTTTMLECAVRDLLPSDTNVPIVTIMPAGSCPGHFDVPPSVAVSLRDARIVLAHSYQAGLMQKLGELAPADARVEQVETSGSLLIPEHYLAVARQVGGVLEQAYPEHRTAIRSNLRRLEQKTAVLSENVAGRRTAWAGKSIIVSMIQREFSEWLALKPIGEVSRPEDVTPAELEALMKSQPALVVGNLQEGPQAAAALAERLNVPLVVFSNFPNADGYGAGYEALLNENIRRLEAACRKR